MEQPFRVHVIDLVTTTIKISEPLGVSAALKRANAAAADDQGYLLAIVSCHGVPVRIVTPLPIDQVNLNRGQLRS